MTITGISERGEVWRAFDPAGPDRAALADRLGWSRASIDTIDAYRDVGTPYTFPTLDEMRTVTDPLFDEIEVQIPSYELGDRCPTVIYRKRET